MFSCHFLLGFLASCLHIVQINKTCRKTAQNAALLSCGSLYSILLASASLNYLVPEFQFFKFSNLLGMMKDFTSYFCLTPQSFFPCLLHFFFKCLNVKMSREFQINLNSFIFLSGIFIPQVLSSLVALCCLQPFGNNKIYPASKIALSRIIVAGTDYSSIVRNRILHYS